jgi:hypothetical protein
MHAATHPANLSRSISCDAGDVEIASSDRAPEEAVSELLAVLDVAAVD